MSTSTRRCGSGRAGSCSRTPHPPTCWPPSGWWPPGMPCWPRHHPPPDRRVRPPTRPNPGRPGRLAGPDRPGTRGAGPGRPRPVQCEIAQRLVVARPPPRPMSAGCWPSWMPATGRSWWPSPTRPAWSLPALAEPPRPAAKTTVVVVADAMEEGAEELVRWSDSVRDGRCPATPTVAARRVDTLGVRLPADAGLSAGGRRRQRPGFVLSRCSAPST